MARIQTATCQDCGWQGPVEDTLDLRHLYERVLPGDVMPAGDCPEDGCGGAAMLDAERDGELDLRSALETLMLGLERLREAICADAPGTSVGARSKQLAASARTAPAAEPAPATRLQYLRQHRRPGRCLGVMGYSGPALGAAQHL